MVDLGAIDEDVPFDAGAADALITACTGAAAVIEGQLWSRASYVSTALKDFKGHFAGLFTDNASTAKGDAHELVARLKEVATGARRLKEEAAKEQKRRETARTWKQERDDRNMLEKGWDSVFGGEDKPPVGPPAAPVNVPVSPAVNTPRKTPSPGSGGGGGSGTSSARPSDLHAFASSSAGLNHGLRPKSSSCKGAYSTFQSTCHWGSLDAAGVFAGFDKWLSANDNDVHWARVVGDAFARAGGEGAVSTLANSAIAATLRAHGVDASRQDLSIDPPTAYGHPPTTGYAVDPVNTSTGNFVETESDLGFTGACSGLELSRTYNSVNHQVGAFGRGWSSWTEAGLRFDDESAAFVMPDGREVTFPRMGAGWDRAVGESLWLAADDTPGDDAFVVSGNDGFGWRFSREGRLIERSAGPGTGLRLEWVQGRLVRLSHERGRSIEVLWDEDRVTGLRASDGREVSYSYDEDGRLVAATTPLGTRQYRWNDENIVYSVLDADGVVEMENAYDEHGRVVRQRTAHGRLVRFVYLPGRVTVVSDEDGSRSNTWVADERGRLVGVVDADEHRQSMAYDPHGNVVMVTERDGSTTVNEYDDRGRLVRRVLPTGADLSWTWDEQDRVTGLTVAGSREDADNGAELSYLYEGDNQNPSLLVDAEGGRSQMTWERGVLTRIVDPTGVEVRFEHDAHGDLVATIDADGNTARLERDASGRVVAAITPSGKVTHFAYDQSTGLLAERVDPDGATWRFEHTTAGRLAATIDPLGARTEIEYSEDGEERRTIDPLGRSVTRHVDELGNLASVELPDGSTWSYAHDAMSRLTSSTSPDGATWTQDYDANGGLRSRTSPTGESLSVSTDVTSGTATVSEGSVPSGDAEGPMTAGIRIDRLGRIVSSERQDGSTVLTRYDKCGRAVELVDAGGGVTVVRRDAAGRPLQVTRPGGGAVSYEYDSCGRSTAVIDELGGRTELRYDVDGQLVAQVLPTGEEANWTYDECGRIIRRRVPGVGTTTVTYDAAGRVVESRDPQLGRRRFVYDAAGQLVEAVNGNGGVTRWEYDANGRAVAITDPEGGVTRREYDAANHVVAETDPLGRRTTAGYDAAGRQVWQVSADGQRTEWRYDAAGRVESVLVDGRLVSSTSRDIRGRTVRVTDHTQPDRESVHELRWDARGLLISRTRDGRGLSWEYDVDGRRTARVGPDGDRVSYEHDAAGRTTAISHPLLGRATFAHDATGRVATARAGELEQHWTYADGFVTTHETSNGTRTAQTLVDRDGLGRVVSVNRDGAHTTYSYDEACQLIEARTGGPDGAVTRWRYDAAGRLVAESRDGSTRELAYDAAGQLVSARELDGRVLSYTYDQQGRRTSVSRSDGSAREFGWGPTGWLASVADRDAAGEQRRVTTAVDAWGELSRLDDAEVFFDTADPYAAVAQLGDRAVVSAGGVTGVGEEWATPGWRGVRTDSADPWDTPAAGVGPAGELVFAGLEWLGARVYDPSARGFLSVDPLDPMPGAGWAGNPYSYAGNDPLHASDPTGLRPATDADLKAWTDAHQGAIHAAGQWLENNWEYVAGGAMVIAGGVLIATGVGGPAGMMLISAGADTIIQKATTGNVNWGEVLVAGAAGGIGGAGVAARAGLTGARATVAAGVVSGAAGGGMTGGYSYVSGPGPHSVGGFVSATGTGMAEGGVLGGAGGAAGHAIGGKIMGAMTHNPSSETMAMGRIMTTRVEPYALEHGYGYYKGTPSLIHNVLPEGSRVQHSVDLWTNKKWINYQMNQGKGLVDIGAPSGPSPLDGKPLGPSDFYDMEHHQVSSHVGRHTAGGQYQTDHQPAWDLRP